MSSPISSGRTDEATYWNEEAGPRWVTLQDRLDALFAGLTAACLAQIAPSPGARVLDIGCGCGATVLALAERVGPTGAVHGVDISAPMLARAAERVAAAGLSQVALTLADAAAHPFAPAGADLVFSRFGVMFFADPVAAFGNIRRALAPGGRLAFLCWRPMPDSAWFMLPCAAVRPHVPPMAPFDPEAPGPFALGDPARTRQVLSAAGFQAIDIAPFDALLPVAAQGEAAAAADFVVQMGPVARALAGGDDAQRAAGIAAVRAALGAAAGPDGLALGAAMWLVTATA
jgi:SAM-dependent methyltransferase